MSDMQAETSPSAGEVLEKLIRATHHLHRQFELKLAATDVPTQLTGPRLRFLIAISEAGQIRMSELGSKIGIQARTVTQFVDALEQESLLMRLPDPKDRRATIIQLTEHAMPIIQNARSAMSDAAEQILEKLPLHDRVTLLAILQTLHPNKLPLFAEES